MKRKLFAVMTPCTFYVRAQDADHAVDVVKALSPFANTELPRLGVLLTHDDRLAVSEVDPAQLSPELQVSVDLLRIARELRGPFGNRDETIGNPVADGIIRLVSASNEWIGTWDSLQRALRSLNVDSLPAEAREVAEVVINYKGHLMAAGFDVDFLCEEPGIVGSARGKAARTENRTASGYDVKDPLSPPRCRESAGCFVEIFAVFVTNAQRLFVARRSIQLS